jgi:hypothetical protein
VRNNPLKYVDPSGHDPKDPYPDNWCNVTPVGLVQSSDFAADLNMRSLYLWLKAHPSYHPARDSYLNVIAPVQRHWIVMKWVSMQPAGRGSLKDTITVVTASIFGAGSELGAGDRRNEEGSQRFLLPDPKKIASKSISVVLYRGFDPDNPVHARQLKDWQQTGTVSPRGGNATPQQHVAGDTSSNYTSWTLNPDTAKKFAGPNGTILTVNLQEVSNAVIPTYHWSIFNESEVLIQGTVRVP